MLKGILRLLLRLVGRADVDSRSPERSSASLTAQRCPDCNSSGYVDVCPCGCSGNLLCRLCQGTGAVNANLSGGTSAS